jgi:HicB family
MDLAPYIAPIEDSLAAASAAGDEGTRRTAAALTAALEPAVRLALMNALADLALEVTEALGDRVVEVRLESGEVRVVVSPLPAVEDAVYELERTQSRDSDGEPSRITLRLPEALKAQAERTAGLQAVSLNTWLTRAVQDALRADRPPAKTQALDERSHRVRGWVQG